MALAAIVFFVTGSIRIASAKTITDTIVVKAGTTYDGKGERITAVGMGSGSQGGNQKPIFKLEKGATLKNVRITTPGCDGVHCYGNNTVDNVVWEDIGENALIVKSRSSNAGTVKITNCQAYKGDDKVIKLNAPCTLKVTNFTADGFGKFIRQNGGTTFKCTIYLDSCTLRNGQECVARTDSKRTVLYYRDLKVINIRTLWIFPSVSQVKPFLT